MKSSQKNSDESQEPTSLPVAFMLGTIGDTTWRMFVPTVGLMSAGYLVDKTLGTKPWFFISGVVLGSIVAGLLIRNQFRKQL
jgi:F0F1-type ATP synthase assembly protein I